MPKTKCTMVARVCETCGIAFETTIGMFNRGGGKFCSVKCSAARFKTRREVSCKQCGAKFEAFKYAVEKGMANFCSTACYHDATRTSAEIPCEHCGAICTRFRSSRSARTYCSRECCNAANPLAVRFPEKVGAVDSNGCMPWLGVRNQAGYGMINDDSGRRARAHRIAYELAKGPIPDGSLVMHLCDNPRCVNPDHLQVGTDADNIADKVSKKRHHYGEKVVFAKLTAEQVREIRAAHSHRSHSEVAAQYSVSRQTITRVLNRDTWKLI